MNSKTNTNKPPCPKCNNITGITKAGCRTSKTGIKRRYFCKSCNSKFTAPQEIIPTSYPDEIILYAFKLAGQISYTYKKEIKLSLEEIAHIINNKFNTKINHNIVSQWIKNYTPK